MRHPCHDERGNRVNANMASAWGQAQGQAWGRARQRGSRRRQPAGAHISWTHIVSSQSIDRTSLANVVARGWLLEAAAMGRPTGRPVALVKPTALVNPATISTTIDIIIRPQRFSDNFLCLRETSRI